MERTGTRLEPAGSPSVICTQRSGEEQANLSRSPRQPLAHWLRPRVRRVSTSLVEHRPGCLVRLRGPSVCAGLSSLLVRWVRSRPLDTSSPEKLAQSFMSRMFIGIGYAESAALVAFVGAFVMSTLWIYLVGLACSTVNLALVAPSHREITRRQEQICAQGSTLSLGAALMASSTPGPPADRPPRTDHLSSTGPTRWILGLRRSRGRRPGG